MPESWERAEGRGWTRREWAKVSLLAGAGGIAALAGSVAVSRLLSPPDRLASIIDERLVYTAFPTPQWWNDLAGQPVRVSDFEPWTGATAVWRGVFNDGHLEPGTGFPVLVVRITSDSSYFRVPTTHPALPAGYDLYYEDAARGIRILVVYERCTHLCCYPGWHVVTNPPPERDYATYGFTPPNPPTYDVYGQDPIYCVCHGAQYDPMLLVSDVNPHNNAPFVGAQVIHGPGTFALPVVPVAVDKDVLYGGMADPRWYEYC